MPYVYYSNGPILATILILLGGALSNYTGYLIAYCAAQTGANSFEEIAKKIGGNTAMKIVSVCNILCNAGFLINYIVLFKTTVAKTLIDCGATLPEWLGDNKTGEVVWDAFFCFIPALLLCLPRQVNSLRYASMTSFLISLFITFTIFSLAFKESADSPLQGQGNSFKDRFHTAMTVNRISVDSIFGAIPFIIFAYMY